MTDTKFTPGPWEVRGFRGLEGPGGRVVRFYGDGISLAMASPSDEDRANYALLKAAPELYAALDAYVNDDGRLTERERKNLAREALAKAVQP